MPKPVYNPKKVKKVTHKFKRPVSHRFLRVKESWRRPKGIDNKVRRRYRGYDIAPKIGYGTKASLRHVLPNGFKKFLVRNVNELEVLLMQNRTYCAEIAAAVSARKRLAIVERAKQLDIKVLNRKARVRTQTHE